MPQQFGQASGTGPSQRELAFHEAGHAVVAALLGQEIEWIVLGRDGCGQAEPKINPFCRLDEPFESRRRIVIAMAGSAAQCKCTGRPARWTPEGRGDRRLAEDNAETAKLPPDNFSLVNGILSQTDVWEKVSRLAIALLKHGELVSWDGLKEFLPEHDIEVCELVGIIPRNHEAGFSDSERN
jgi:hypothetical protein